MAESVLIIDSDVTYIVFKPDGSGKYVYDGTFTGPGMLTDHLKEEKLDYTILKIFKQVKEAYVF